MFCVFWSNDDRQGIRTIADTHSPTDYTAWQSLPVRNFVWPCKLVYCRAKPVLPHIPFRLHNATALVGQGFLIMEVSRSHSDTLYSVGLLWGSVQPDAETSTWQHTTLTRHRHPPSPHPGRIQTRNSNKRAAADPRLRSSGHWDRPPNS